MSSSTWEERPTSAQMNPSHSYRPDDSYVPSLHGSGKKSNEDQGRGVGDYASQPSAPRGYSEQGCVKGYGSGVKGCGSKLYRNHSTTHSSQDGRLKDIVNDHYGNVGDTRGSSDCGYGSHYSSDHAKNETHEQSDYISNPKDYVRPGLSWLDRRSFHTGEPCAIPLDWDHHPTLRQVPPDAHHNYRHAKLEEWLSTAHKRRSKEHFGAYIWRASALANSELKHRKKQCWGDEYGNPLDKFVMRLFYGMKLKLERTESIVLGVDDETGILDILREECVDLSKSGQLPFDQRSIQYTPLIMSELRERSSNGTY